MTDTVPRRSVEPVPVRRVAQAIAENRKAIAAQGKAAPLRNASISGGEGLKVKDLNRIVRFHLDPDQAAIIAYKQDGTEAARFGLLANSDGAGGFGIEAVDENGEWVWVGNETVTWGNVQGIPASFPAAPHHHPGSDIDSAVANANNAAQATNAARADDADGPTPEAFARDVAGIPGTWWQVYMHSNGQFGRGTSNAKYKRNVRPFALTADQVMRFRLVIYDRKATNADDYTPPVSVDELGLLAGEVEAIAPELVEYFEGEADNVKYALVGVALLPVIQDTLRDVASLRATAEAQAKLIETLTTRLNALDGQES